MKNFRFWYSPNWLAPSGTWESEWNSIPKEYNKISLDHWWIYFSLTLIRADMFLLRSFLVSQSQSKTSTKIAARDDFPFCVLWVEDSLRQNRHLDGLTINLFQNPDRASFFWRVCDIIDSQLKEKQLVRDLMEWEHILAHLCIDEAHLSPARLALHKQSELIFFAELQLLLARLCLSDQHSATRMHDLDVLGVLNLARKWRLMTRCYWDHWVACCDWPLEDFYLLAIIENRLKLRYWFHANNSRANYFQTPFI